MRTTLDIADDVLLAAKEMARRDKRTVGDVLSTLARTALLAPQGAGTASTAGATPAAAKLARLGITPLPHRGGIVTEEIIHRIREEEGI